MNREPNLNQYVPTSARIWDALRGGKDYHDIDRLVAHQMLAVAPCTRTVTWFVQRFHHQSVRSATEAGIRQFIDLGTGYVADPALSVAGIARTLVPALRVVFIDNDPVVRTHCEVLLATAPGLTALQADIRRPHEIIDVLRTGLIDFSVPVALSAIGVLDYVLDDEDPAGIIAAFRELMAPGSRLTVTHWSDESDRELMDTYHSYTMDTAAQATFRPAAQIATLTKGFDLAHPGWVPVQQLLDHNLPATRLVVLGAECTVATSAPSAVRASMEQVHV